MDNDSLIRVEHLSRRYGDNLAVNDVSFEVKRGEVLGFLGPNGAGKSTTMQMLTGNLAPTTGSITINGIDMLESPKAAKERCGLTEVGRRLINNLSKGYQQRVGIAQAIIHSPDVVILDEPTVGLDPIQIREIRKLIRDIGEEHSVILSTHILPEVQATCDQVQIINKGQLVLNDSIDGLTRRMQTSSLVVALRQPPTIDILQALPGIDAVETLEDGRVRLSHAPDQNPAEGIVERSVAEGWGLYELTPERLSLEDVFVNITTSEQKEEDAA